MNRSYMECFSSSVVTSKCEGSSDSISKYKLVVFTDSTECSPCNISRITDWKDVAQDIFKDCYSDAKLLFIISPSRRKMQEIRQIVEESSMDWPIYLDTAYVFQKVNIQIPDNRLFHVFLLNENDEILCVGNPLYNEKIRRIYKTVIKERNINNSL